MEIRMAGIDSSRAPVGVRERFAMTASAASEAAARACREFGAKGCVLLSTCNRTELWLSGRASLEPYELLCALRGAEPGAHRDCFVRREGLEAAEHLFQLACGMKSQVFGEDQILTQVGTALSLAREAGAADAVLETLFRSAVTSAKKVKTAVRLTEADQSVAVRMEAFLKGVMGPLAGTPCLVIGNGEMGRLAARRLVEAGCRVSMTVRRYRHGEVSLPDGVEAVSYEERLSLLPRVRLVVSATASPHYTLRAAEVGPALSGPKVFCDLAVPRDIDPAIASLPGARVYDTDGICGVADARRDEAALMRARRSSRTARFARWYGFRAVVPAAGSPASSSPGILWAGWKRRCAASDSPGRRRASASCGLRRKRRSIAAFGLRETLPSSCGSPVWTRCIWPPEGAPNPRGRAILPPGPRPEGRKTLRVFRCSSI
ncbi:MAG: glutamyl-tRNA reductase [Anaerotruncus massiliensis (ex Togo et al. 2019)]